MYYHIMQKSVAILRPANQMQIAKNFCIFDITEPSTRESNDKQNIAV